MLEHFLKARLTQMSLLLRTRLCARRDQVNRHISFAALLTDHFVSCGRVTSLPPYNLGRNHRLNHVWPPIQPIWRLGRNGNPPRRLRRGSSLRQYQTYIAKREPNAEPHAPKHDRRKMSFHIATSFDTRTASMLKIGVPRSWVRPPTCTDSCGCFGPQFLPIASSTIFTKKCPLVSSRVRSCPLLSHSYWPQRSCRKNPCYNSSMSTKCSFVAHVASLGAAGSARVNPCPFVELVSPILSSCFPAMNPKLTRTDRF